MTTNEPSSSPANPEETRHQRWQTRCNSCQLVIAPEEASKKNVIFSLGRFWHRDHFNCSRCNAEIGKNRLEFRANRSVPNTPICLDCHMEEKHPKCAKCNKTLYERCVQALGAQYHKSCLKCTKCRCPFADGEYYLLDNKPYDVDCYHVKRYEAVIGKPPN